MHHPVLGARVDAAVRHTGQGRNLIAHVNDFSPGAATVPGVVEDRADGEEHLQVIQPVEMTAPVGTEVWERRPGPPGQASISGPIEVGRAPHAGTHEQQAVRAAQIAGKRLDGPGSRFRIAARRDRHHLVIRTTEINIRTTLYL